MNIECAVLGTVGTTSIVTAQIECTLHTDLLRMLADGGSLIARGLYRLVWLRCYSWSATSLAVTCHKFTMCEGVDTLFYFRTHITSRSNVTGRCIACAVEWPDR